MACALSFGHHHHRADGLIFLETVMDKEKLEAIHTTTDSLELRVNDTMKDVLEQYDPDVAVNVLINVATSMLAKALIMSDPEQRVHLAHIAERFTAVKVKEGHAAVESLMAIGKAMNQGGKAYTCQPQTKKS